MTTLVDKTKTCEHYQNCSRKANCNGYGEMENPQLYAGLVDENKCDLYPSNEETSSEKFE